MGSVRGSVHDVHEGSYHYTNESIRYNAIGVSELEFTPPKITRPACAFFSTVVGTMKAFAANDKGDGFFAILLLLLFF